MGAHNTVAADAAIDRDLVAQAAKDPRSREGQAAFAELVKRHTRKAHAHAFSVLKNADDAREVVQDAFMRVWRHVDDFAGQASFGTWFYRIVHNLCIDRARARKQNVLACGAPDGCGADDTESVPVAHVGPDALDLVLAAEEAREAQAALDTLPAIHRAVILARMDGASYQEIASAHGVPKGTVMSRVFHARRGFEAVRAGEVTRPPPAQLTLFGITTSVATAARVREVTASEEIGRGSDRSSVDAAYNGAGEEDNMTRSAFKDIGGKPGVNLENVDPYSVSIVGYDDGSLNKETARREDSFANREIAAMLSDPDGFFASHPDEQRRLYNLNNVLNLVQYGLAVPVKVHRVGEVFAVVYGRHRTAWMRLVHDVFAGKRDVKLLRAAVAAARSAKGDDACPAFYALPAGSRDLDAIDNMMDVENGGHQIETTEQKYLAAMKRIGAAEDNGKKVDAALIKSVATARGVGEYTIKAWMKLRNMPQSVIDAVLADLIPVTAAVEFAGKKNAAEIIAELIRTNAANVRDARATAKSHRDGGDGEGSDGESGGTPKPAVKFANKPVGGRFVSEYETSLDGKGNRAESLILIGMKLASSGYASLTPAEREAVANVKSLKDALDAARKADTARAKKRAEKRAANAAASTPDAGEPDEEDDAPAAESSDEGDAPESMVASAGDADDLDAE